MRQLGVALGSVLVAVSLTMGSASQAAALDIEWCAIDPIVQVLGAQFHLKSQVAASASSVSSVAYVVDVPSNAGSVEVRMPQGGIAQTVEIRYTQPAHDGTASTFQVRTSITVNSTADAATTVDLSGRSVDSATFSGRTNKALDLKFDVSAK